VKREAETEAATEAETETETERERGYRDNGSQHGATEPTETHGENKRNSSV